MIAPDGDLLFHPILPPPNETYQELQLTDEQSRGLYEGSLKWDIDTQTVVSNPGYTDEATAKANRLTLEKQALTSFQANKDFLNVANPNNAAVLAQVKALTRQNNGIIRLLLGRLESAD
jgi:hypothetical protein